MDNYGCLGVILFAIGIATLLLYALVALFGIAIAIAGAYGFIRTIINYVLAVKEVVGKRRLATGEGGENDEA